MALHYLSPGAASGGITTANTGRILKTQGSFSIASIGTTEVIAMQYVMVGNGWALGDRIRYTGAMTKSGLTNTGVLRIRVGTTGTVGGDSSAYSVTWLLASQSQAAVMVDIRLDGSQMIQPLSTNLGFSTAGTGALNSSAIAANLMSGSSYFISIGILCGVSDVVKMVEGELEYRPMVP